MQVRKIIDLISNYFNNQDASIKRDISRFCTGILLSGNCSSLELCRPLTSTFNQELNTIYRGYQRFLDNKSFYVGDKLFRCSADILFNVLQRLGLKSGDILQINIDQTSNEDDFIILYASVVFMGASFPLKFSVRKYPSKKFSSDQKKFEEAFLRSLRHILSKKYQYVIVMDRGYGNGRIIKILKELQFNFVIRIKNDLKIIKDAKRLNIKDIANLEYDFKECYGVTWDEEFRLSSYTKNNEKWLIISDLYEHNYNDIRQHYEQRFSIEKMFYNQKSGGFNIEKSKIKKQDRYIRMLYLVMISHLIGVTIGLIVDKKQTSIKKNFVFI